MIKHTEWLFWRTIKLIFQSAEEIYIIMNDLEKLTEVYLFAFSHNT